jgi:hypothetical protein
MNYFEVLLHPNLILATLLYTTMVIVFEVLYQHLLHKISDVSGSYWIARQIGEPFFHVLLLVALIYMSYPVLFGLEVSHTGQLSIPSLNDLLNAKPGQTTRLVNTLFIISILLPIIPMMQRFMMLILPFQAMVGSAMLYSWLAQYQQINYSLTPSLKTFILIMLFSILAGLLAKSMASLLGSPVNERFNLSDARNVIEKSCLLILQMPVLLIYTLSLPSR